jgi:large repetitive protein
VVDPALSSVTGTVYSDLNGNHMPDANEPRLAGWIVEVVKAGAVAATTNTDANGVYVATNLLSGPGYDIRFRNPENGVVYRILTNVTLNNNATVADQNQPIDPSGIVYDSVTRNPVLGVTMRLLGANGAPLPAACFLDVSQQGQVTGVSGDYQFNIIPGAAAACPTAATVYTLGITPRAGYSVLSTVLLPQIGPFSPTGRPAPVAISPSANPPVAGAAAIYYLDFRLQSGDPDIIFNHVPLDPFLTRTPLIVTKTSIKRSASVGDLVPYTIMVRNAEAVQRAGVSVIDIIPPGFKYVAKTASINGVPSEPMLVDRQLRWRDQIIPASGIVTYDLMMVVGAGVTDGEKVNTGLARNDRDNADISNRGTAVVSITPSAVFDCAEMLGKVFDDANRNGHQDDGERGLPGVRLATVNGLLVTTDNYGRYHIACAAVPDARIGSNFVLKIDPATLPPGYAPTQDNPQSIRLTRGKFGELNFGAAPSNAAKTQTTAGRE